MHQTRTMAWLLTGRGTVLDAAKEPFGQGAIALVTTTLDVSAVLANPIVQADITREMGHNEQEFEDEWDAQSKHPAMTSSSLQLEWEGMLIPTTL